MIMKRVHMTLYFLLISIASFLKQYEFLIYKNEKSHLQVYIFCIVFRMTHCTRFDVNKFDLVSVLHVPALLLEVCSGPTLTETNLGTQEGYM